MSDGRMRDRQVNVDERERDGRASERSDGLLTRRDDEVQRVGRPPRIVAVPGGADVASVELPVHFVNEDSHARVRAHLHARGQVPAPAPPPGPLLLLLLHSEGEVGERRVGEQAAEQEVVALPDVGREVRRDEDVGRI